MRCRRRPPTSCRPRAGRAASRRRGCRASSRCLQRKRRSVWGEGGRTSGKAESSGAESVRETPQLLQRRVLRLVHDDKRGLVRAAAHAGERLRLEQPRGGQGVCRRVVAHHLGDGVDEWRQEPPLGLLLLLLINAPSGVRAAEDDLGDVSATLRAVSWTAPSGKQGRGPGPHCLCAAAGAPPAPRTGSSPSRRAPRRR